MPHNAALKLDPFDEAYWMYQQNGLEFYTYIRLRVVQLYMIESAPIYVDGLHLVQEFA